MEDDWENNFDNFYSQPEPTVPIMDSFNPIQPIQENAMPWESTPPITNVQNDIQPHNTMAPMGPDIQLQGNIADDGYEWIEWGNQWYWRDAITGQWLIFEQ